MISKEAVEHFKMIAPMLVNLVPGGVIFGSTNLEEYTWKLASKSFDMARFLVGSKFSPGGAADQTIKSEKTITVILEDGEGGRVLVTTAPVYEDNKVVGTFRVIQPRVHPLFPAFEAFAPIVAEMYGEGAFLWLTDTKKNVGLQDSPKFQVPNFKIGDPPAALAQQVIDTGKPINVELDAKDYGVPIQTTGYPIFDIDDPEKLVGTFGFLTPRRNATRLRNMSDKMEKSITEIAAVVQQLAATASDIAANEGQLNRAIAQVYEVSEKINEVIGFVNQIAAETKMLGLNAAIEAARAGEVGRGFGVVAEEIRKLSDQSRDTVVTIRDLTVQITDQLDNANEISNKTLRSSEEQAAATQEISAAVQEMTKIAERLDKVAQQV
ncbi:MAG: methyl-accepting chemotaxis protein [Syntrophomonadaceae bacterium]|nr:methyl-accepting chemotaxis protein [Syntrophomonadaceae bacterium]